MKKYFLYGTGGHRAIKIMFLICLAVALTLVAGSGSSQLKKLKGSGTKLSAGAGGLKTAWTHTFPEPIAHAFVATGSGDVVAHSLEKVWYVGSNGQVRWSKGEGQGWKYICGAGISNDGTKVLFQTDVNPHTATNAMNLTVHLVKDTGEEYLSKANPFVYNVSQLSPTGKYILFGDAIEKGAKLTDDQLNKLWERDLYLWYLMFDGTENYLFDPVDGLLFNMEGRQVFDYGARGNKAFSISDNAEVVLVKKAMGSKNKEMFLMNKKLFKRVDMEGEGGCVSPDGSMMAVITSGKKLSAFKTEDVLNAGNINVKPVFQTGFQIAQEMSISRDNKTLYVRGDDSAGQISLMLADLQTGTVLWKIPAPNALKGTQAMDNHEYIMAISEPSTILMIKGR